MGAEDWCILFHYDHHYDHHCHDTLPAESARIGHDVAHHIEQPTLYLPASSQGGTASGITIVAILLAVR
ncbi:hypothetical protein V8D89_000458, partial [Ganoderma adspersum]